MGDDVGDAEGLARARNAQQRLVRQPRLDAFDHLPNGLRLIAGRLETGDQFELGHFASLGNMCELGSRTFEQPSSGLARQPADPEFRHQRWARRAEKPPIFPVRKTHRK